jgi:predicted nuclease of restriction endonuclease-like (RecB) superfamily
LTHSTIKILPMKRDENRKRTDRVLSDVSNAGLIKDIRLYIEQAHEHVATTANSEITMMYWHIGKRINRDILGKQRAEYGKQIVSTLSSQLAEEYGKGFEPRNIHRMMQFAEKFPDIQIVSTVSTQLSWSHFMEVLPINDPLAREFYITMALKEKWSIRMLRNKMDSMLYERTAISEKPDEFIKKELDNLRDNDILTPDLVFKSPYFLEFTGLKGMYNEKSLEDCLVAGLEQFILELGSGFTFVERQKRMIIDGEDFYLDLLFFHRRLHRLIAIELKLGKFKAPYKGQMELYLRWLEKNEKEPGEESPLGLLLCTEGNEEQIELLQLDKTGIRIAQYLTDLPSRTLLQKQLKRSLIETKRQQWYFKDK